ncbi:MAG: choice-of-anchor D domain-containing protein, partial [FCB group bacterium]
MKKFFFLAVSMLLLTLSFNSLFSGSPRLVLVEEVTSANCGICAAENGSFYNYLSNNTDKALAVVYHSGNGQAEPMYDANPLVLNNRIWGVYVSGTLGTPAAWANGTKIDLGNVSGEVAKYNNQTSPYSIYVMENRKGTSDTLTVVVKSDVAVSGNKRLFCAVIETPLTFSHAGSNGETNFPYVARDMFPGPGPTDGFQLNMQSGGTTTYQKVFTLNQNWNAANVYIVAFIQDLASSNKEVLQCAKTMDASKVYPQISADMNTLNFGNVSDNSTKTIQLTNTGLKSLTITSLKIENDADSVFSLVSSNIPALLPGATYNVQVAFNPQVDGNYTAKLRVQSNSQTQGNFTIALAGTGQGVIAKPKIQMDITSLDFSNVSDSKEMTCDVNNTGRGDLIINNIFIDNNSDPVFSLATPTTDTVKPGDKLTIKVDFAPIANGTYTGTLVISSNAGADVSIDLSGTGSNVKMISKIETDSSSLYFGQVSRSDYSKDLQFTIFNKGNASLLVD